MGETPLFFAVKNDFMNCVNLLLRHGASTQLFNLRKQRPIDLAKSQDMRFLLSQMSIRFWSGAEPITQEISPSYSSNDDQSDSDGQMLDIFANAQLDSSASERFSNTGSKRQLCRFFESLGGCSRGTTCYYAHGEEELLFSSPSSGNDKHQLGYEHMMKQGTPTFHSPNTEELKRKIFIGGLPPSVDSGTLKELFEHQFGSVEEATVIGNQSGKHVVSRGFGFVTFKSQESVIAAVNAHYVMISGKKVEIKGAIPKPKSPSEPAQPKSRQLEYHVLSPSGPRQRSGKLEPLTWLDTLLCSTTQDFKIENSFDSTSSDGIQNLLPQWVNTFRKWLPGFLQEVSKRLKEGELYPLSSLKGDFRATCGLELDHASLGYVKLSDFVRSFPGICRMKVVPVGRHGAATHMVLLPNLPSSPHHNRRHQLTPITSTDYSSNNSNLALLAENDSDDDDDDDDDTRLIEDLMLDVNSRCATIQHYYQGTSGSSGHEGVKKEGTNMQGDQGAGFQRFLEAIRPTEDGQWPPWPGGSSGSGGSGGEDTNRHVVLEALSNESKDFSYFHCQYDFHERYRKRLEKQRCFRCNINRMLWYSYPCNHKLWCEPCRKWVDTQIREALRGGCKRSDIKCVYCNRVMERHGFHVWGNKLNNEQPDNEQQPNNQQQPMGDGEGEGEGSQLNNEQQPVVANQQPNINLNNQLDFPPLG
ncbi:hypothetical protein Scep_017382 [Stephania cephalantha]|uniref:Uncharacterized protein n=1 Tax=Stephania cephalantha TaxID=152367 RepID=A0AAP0NUY0_9MAGN